MNSGAGHPRLDVLHICYGGLGGHHNVVTTLAEGMRQRGIKSGVAAIAPPHSLVRSPDEWGGCDYVSPVPLTRRGDLTSLRGVYRAVRETTPRVCVVHAHRHTSAVKLAALAGRRPCPLVIVEHQPIPLRSWADNINSGVSLLLGNRLITLTSEYMDQYPLRHLAMRLPLRKAVIPNGVDTNVFYPSISSFDPSAAPVFGTAMRLEPSKDARTLLEAFALLRREFVDVPSHLVIAGAGSLMSECEQFARDLQIERDVTFLGRLPEAAMPEFMRSLQVYVQATRGETLSTSLIQAAASGLPIVASRVSGISNMFDDGGTALLVTPSDPGAMAAAFRRLLDPSERSRLASASRVLAEKEYSAETMVRRYLSVFRELDEGGPWAKIS